MEPCRAPLAPFKSMRSAPPLPRREVSWYSTSSMRCWSAFWSPSACSATRRMLESW
ncbi:hypothetical protein [Lysobacter gummosus]|uniref:hypothetical protein n=1 Tax=Lysobacter gummosus TaxID=262324 RepID=UPI00363E00EB